MFRIVRLIILISILFFVSLAAYQLSTNLKNWNNSKWVVIYPINADGNEITAKYINRLDDGDFANIADFLNKQAEKFGLNHSSLFRVKLGPTITQMPPDAPQQGNWLNNVWWSLKLRYWASEFNENDNGPPADVKVFVEYYDPNQHSRLAHSVGMSKLSLAVVKAFATRKMRKTNNVIIAHELLHVFGAIDKYDLATNLPLFPDGYANPKQTPLFPQKKAELMGGRIPLSKDNAEIPPGFKFVIVGKKTAQEIGWLNKD